jgi:Flp pilus assembly protein TadB
MMTLSDYERRQLHDIEDMTRGEDQRFADALASGHPRQPREYRRRRLLLAGAGVATAVAFILVFLGIPYGAAVMFVALLLTGAAMRL